MATSVVVRPLPRALPTILGGGLLAAILDHTDATIRYTLMMGIPQSAMFHYIASGLIGMQASMRLGRLGVLLGILCHFTIATGAATVFYLSARKFPFLIRRPFFSGAIFGVGLYIFMTYIVLPLSRVPKNPHQTFSWLELASGLFAHIVLIGIPIALIAQRSARVKPSKVV